MLSDPPRAVPLSLRISFLLGGFPNQFGWLLVGVGMSFVWMFGGTNLLRDVVLFRGDLSTAPARVSAIERTNVTINDRRVYRYEYTYSVDGVEHSGVTRGFLSRLRVDDSVAVEYRADEPGRSRIPDVSTGSSPSLLLLVFPLAGLVFVAFGLRKGLRGARLLRDGKQATGTLVSVEPTSTRVNDEVVYAFTFAFEAADGRTYEVAARTHDVARFVGEDGVETVDGRVLPEFGGVEEPLVYSPEDPLDAMVLDDLPGGPRIDEQGEIRTTGPSRIPILIIPLLTVVGHTWWLLRALEAI